MTDFTSEAEQNEVTLKMKVRNKLGLHARPAALLVQAVTKYECEVTLVKGTQTVNGKSIMGVMMLAAGPNAVLTFTIKGPDAGLAAKEVEALFERNFDE